MRCRVLPGRTAGGGGSHMTLYGFYAAGVRWDFATT
jgi:hypothetical protein